MKVFSTDFPDVLILEPEVFKDERGFFLEMFNKKTFQECTGQKVSFVQDNLSQSHKGVLRGLHYQIKQPQGKLIQVLRGAVFDVAVDIRKQSPSFGKWVGVELSAENKRQVWIPPGFAHGFLALSDTVDICYKVTKYRAPQWERTIRWDDPQLGIKWPTTESLTLSPKDAMASLLQDADLYR